MCLADFLGSMITLTITLARRKGRTLRHQLGARICLRPSLPKPFNGPFRRSAEVSLLRLHIARHASHGILTVRTIALAIRLKLRTRLTPG